MADLMDLIWFGSMIVNYILGRFYFLFCVLFELNVFVLLFIFVFVFVCVCVFIFYIWQNYQDTEANQIAYRRHEPSTDQFAFRRHEDIDVKLSYITKRDLNVTKILERDVELRDWTMKRHFYFGSSDTFCEQDAIQISIERGSDFLERSNENTVFAMPNGFMLCQTDYWKIPMSIISKEPVTTYQCTYDNGNWQAEYKGKYFAIFDVDGRHLTGETFKNVVFPNE